MALEDLSDLERRTYEIIKEVGEIQPSLFEGFST